ncbi:hypothetical protein [Tateyamaria sp.]
MKFEDVYSRRTADKLTQEQAAEIPGVSVLIMRGIFLILFGDRIPSV